MSTRATFMNVHGYCFYLTSAFPQTKNAFPIKVKYTLLFNSILGVIKYKLFRLKITIIIKFSQFLKTYLILFFDNIDFLFIYLNMVLASENISHILIV